MNNKLFLILLLFTLCSNTFGQNKDKVVRKDTISSFSSNGFFDNWSIGVAAGANIYFGEEDSKANFEKRITPSFEISATKTATPIISFRVLTSGGFMHSFDKKLQLNKMNAVSAQLHVLFDINNAIWGYKENRRYSIIPYIGTGGIISWGNDWTNRELLLPIGILNKIYLSPRFDLTVDLRHVLVNPRMNNIVARGRLYEGMGTLSVGISYKIGKRCFRKSQKPVQYQSTNDFAYSNKEEQAKSEKNVNIASIPIADKSNVYGIPVMKRDTVLIRDTVYITPPLILFFSMNQSVLTDNELIKLDQYMQYVLQKAPNREFKIFTIAGHADRDTGNSEINQRLSENRINTVCHILTEKYKIPSERIILKALGDTNNPFEVPSSNRAVIIQ